MSEFAVFSSSSAGRSAREKLTGDRVVEIRFNSATFMVSPHPERGNAVAVSMQGSSMAIPVATILVEDYELSETTWETPFSGRPPEWQGVLLDLVAQHADVVITLVGVVHDEGSQSTATLGWEVPYSPDA